MASPALEKGKLDTVRKLLSNEEQKLQHSQATADELQKERDLLKSQLEDKQQAARNEQNGQDGEQLHNLRSEKEKIQQKIDEIRSEREKAQADHAAQVSQIKRERQRLETERNEKQAAANEEMTKFERQLQEIEEEKAK